VFLTGLHRAERTIAERLTRLANGTLPWPWIDPDKALPWVEKQGIAHRRHDHGNCRGCILGCDRGRRSSDYDQIDSEADQFGCQFREPLGSTISGAVFNCICLSFDVTKLP
jgi:hypothetical protein